MALVMRIPEREVMCGLLYDKVNNVFKKLLDQSGGLLLFNIQYLRWQIPFIPSQGKLAFSNKFRLYQFVTFLSA